MSEPLNAADLVPKLKQHGQHAFVVAQGSSLVTAAAAQLEGKMEGPEGLSVEARKELELTVIVALDGLTNEVRTHPEPTALLPATGQLLRALAALGAALRSGPGLVCCLRAITACIRMSLHPSEHDKLDWTAFQHLLDAMALPGLQTISHALAYAVTSFTAQLAALPNAFEFIFGPDVLGVLSVCLSAWPLDAAVGIEVCNALAVLAEIEGSQALEGLPENVLSSIAQLVSSPSGDVVARACGLLERLVPVIPAVFVSVLAPLLFSAEGLARVLMAAPWTNRQHKAAMRLLSKLSLNSSIQPLCRQCGLAQLCVTSLERCGLTACGDVLEQLQAALIEVGEPQMSAWVASREHDANGLRAQGAVSFDDLKFSVTMRALRPAPPRSLFAVPKGQTMAVADECGSDDETLEVISCSQTAYQLIVSERMSHPVPQHSVWAPESPEPFGRDSDQNQRALVARICKERAEQREPTRRGSVTAREKERKEKDTVLYNISSGSRSAEGSSRQTHPRGSKTARDHRTKKASTGKKARWLQFESRFESGNLELAIGVRGCLCGACD